MEYIAYKRVLRETCLIAVFLRTLKDDGVDGGSIEDVGNRGVIAVLFDGSGDRGYFHRVTVRGYALGQGSKCLLIGLKLSPLNGLTTPCRERYFLTESCVNEVCLCVLKKLGIVVGLHFGSEESTTRGVGVRISEHLQIKFNHIILLSVRERCVLLTILFC